MLRLARVVVLLLLTAAVAGVLHHTLTGATASGSAAPGLHFAATVAPADAAAVRAAVAAARPEARALIAQVDAPVDISVGRPASGAVGTTTSTGTGYDVVLDLGLASRLFGQRGVSRLVLHELGHVVDWALLDDALRARLDAGIPRGWGCEGGSSGACAAREERFAESFAKWATGDIGVDLDLGYKVPPPGSLETWGAPLAALQG